MMDYAAIRDQIRTGDLLFWSIPLCTAFSGMFLLAQGLKPAAVESGSRPMPTMEELIGELPELVWPQ